MLTMGVMKEEFKRQYMIAKSVGELSPEASELFSKMIDSDEASALELSKPLFTAENAKMLGMSEAQLKAYTRNKAIELEESAGNTRDKALELIEKRKQSQWRNDVKQQKEALLDAVSYTHLTLPTKPMMCRSRWSPYH